jgi:hypothetical protein
MKALSSPRGLSSGNLKIRVKIGHTTKRCWNLASSRKVNLCGHRDAGNTGKTPGTGAFFVWCGAAEYDSSDG